jgi:hypothetical protein
VLRVAPDVAAYVKGRDGMGWGGGAVVYAGCPSSCPVVQLMLPGNCPLCVLVCLCLCHTLALMIAVGLVHLCVCVRVCVCVCVRVCAVCSGCRGQCPGVAQGQ